MKYILRTFWLIGYMPVFIFASIIFFVMIFIYLLALPFYFIKTGSCKNCTFNPPFAPSYITDKYEELLKYL